MGNSSDVTGILTEKDTEWLRRELEYDHPSSASDRKKAIRDRVKSAMKDFIFLMEHWEHDQLYKCFDELEEESGPHPVTCVQNMIALSYVALNRKCLEMTEFEPGDVVQNALTFRRALTGGILDGKTAVGEPPGTVLIDSNVPLYELPSVDEIVDLIDYQEAGDKDDVYHEMLDPHTGEPILPEHEYISKEGAAVEFRADVLSGISRELVSRRMKANSDIIRYDHVRT